MWPYMAGVGLDSGRRAARHVSSLSLYLCTMGKPLFVAIFREACDMWAHMTSKCLILRILCVSSVRGTFVSAFAKVPPVCRETNRTGRW
eukprot:6501104-Pyramimonas_sp.AAC.1